MAQGPPLSALRKDFPILSRRIDGKRLVYLDNAATTHKPVQVLGRIEEYYRRENANVHRGMHTLSQEATDAYEGARERIARFIGARSPKEIIFTKNATEALNLAAGSLSELAVGEGEKIVSTEMEHHSNLVPWQQAARRHGARLELLEVDMRTGLLDEGTFKEKIAGAKIVSLTHSSNVLGTINPVAKIAAMARKEGAYVVVDGAQSVPHMRVDVGSLGCDMLAFSGHKMCGPTGIGVLWGKEELLERMPPFLFGGDMISEVTFSGAKWNDLPWKFEAGTPPIAQAIGLGAACDYLKKAGMGRIRAHEMRLTKLALSLLSEQGDVRVFGPADAAKKGGVVAFGMEGAHPHDIAAILDREGIAVRSGHHCAQPLTRKLGVFATSRASFYFYNTGSEVEFFARSLEKVRKVFGGRRRGA